MQEVAKNELKRMRARTQFDGGLRLPSAEMNDLIFNGRQGHIERRHFVDIDKEVVMAGIGEVDPGGRHPAALKAEAHRHRTRYLFAIERRDDVNAIAGWIGRSLDDLLGLRLAADKEDEPKKAYEKGVFCNHGK